MPTSAYVIFYIDHNTPLAKMRAVHKTSIYTTQTDGAKSTFIHPCAQTLVGYRYGMNTAIDNLSNSYFSKLLALSPELTTMTGLAGADESTLSDYSPAGIAQHADLAKSTLADLAKLEAGELSERDRISAAALRERLSLDVELFEAGETIGELNVIESPIQGIRDIFDLMPTATAEDWHTIARRMDAVPAALAGYEESLAYRREHGPVFALRQIERCIEQCESLAGPSSTFRTLASSSPEDLRGELEKAAERAGEAYAHLAGTLRELAPSASEIDAVGRERYERFSRLFLGTSVDLDETYEWGKAELAEIIAEQERIAQALYGSGVSVNEAMDRLNKEERYTLHGTDALRAWMQNTADEAMRAIEPYFDLPEPLKTIECMVLEDGTGGIYYTGPSDDFSRPGRMWWSVPSGVETFATWQEKTTVFHEGVPGHHLQVGLTTYLREELNDWRRQGCWVSGHGEGWALYAEQLMAELGFQDDLGDRMGVLDSMRLRAARVVVDLGVHVGKPAEAPYREASTHNGLWDHNSAWAFLRENVAMEKSFLSFELDRYLGWPGQAPSYKIGQRMWNQMREEARMREGAHFDMKAWHMKALSCGSLGIDVLREALTNES